MNKASKSKLEKLKEKIEKKEPVINLSDSSFEELMGDATHLSFSLAYETLTPNGHYFDPRDTTFAGKHEDLIWSWCDGLHQKWLMGRMNNRCSLQATIGFDIAKEEKEIVETIKIFRSLLAKVGEPIKLTPEIMKERGYIGY